MASTYTVNLGIEKIATGEQSGTWGATTNTNFDIIDQAINGAATVTLVSAGTSGSPNTLAITDGSTSDGRNKFIDFADGGDLGGPAYVQLTPNDAEKLVHIRNSLSGGRSVIIFQGTYNASNDFEIPNGKDVVLKFDGGGASATVTQVFEDLLVTAIAATTVDTTNIEVTNLKAKDGTAAGSIADSTGVVTIASSVLTTTDINGGSVDGVTLGTNSAVTEAQIDNININGNTISSTDTNGNVTITPDGTGSVAITKIDVAGGEIDGTTIGANSASTGSFTTLNATGGGALTGTWTDLGSVTTVDINGGTIDGVTIGGSSAGAITGTTGQFNTSLNVDGTVTAGGLTVESSDNATGAVTTLSNTNTSTDSNTVIGALIFKNNDGSAGAANAEIKGFSAGTNGQTDLYIRTGSAGTLYNRAKFDFTGDISFYEDTGTTPKFFWDASAESLGIGTTSPSNPLEVIGSTDANIATFSTLGDGGGASNRGLSIAADTYGGSIRTVGSGVSMGFDVNSSEAMRIDTSGRLLVGASSTVSVANSNAFIQQHGNKSTVNLALAAFNNNAGGPILALGASRSTTVGTVGTVVVNGDTLGEIRFAGDDGTDMNTTGAAITAQVDGTPGSNDMPGRLVFSTTADGSASASERMRITSAGNVGIGTTSPSSRLNIVQASDSLVAGFRSDSPTSNSYAALSMDGDDAFVVAGNSGGENTNLRFYTAAAGSETEAMRIDSSGNVGIGVTPSAWSGIGKTLQINTGGSISADTANTYFATNAYYNGTNWVYNTSNYSTRYTSGAGQHQWYTAGSGTAGNTISFTQAMTLDASGNLGLGTTSPSEKIDIEQSGANSAGISLNQTGTGGHDYRISSSGTGYGSAGNLVVYDATAASERMRIDSSGNVLVGGTTAALSAANRGNITINGSAGAILNLTYGGTATSYFYTDNTLAKFGTYTSIPLTFATADTERMRIDSSGSLLHGTTDSSVYNATSGDGVNIKGQQGQIIIAKNATSSADPALWLNNTGVDGAIATFAKDGTPFGSIGNDTTALTIGSGSTGFKFGSAAIWATTGGSTNADGTKDLGASTVRFKDLYLSGGVYLGGTVAANQLDDYEEGTWTPGVDDGTNTGSLTAVNAIYTKIGQVVHIRAALLNLDTTGLTAGAALRITGLPFAPPATTNSDVYIPIATNLITTTKGICAELNNGGTALQFLEQDEAKTGTKITVSAATSGNADIFLSFTYHVG